MDIHPEDRRRRPRRPLVGALVTMAVLLALPAGASALAAMPGGGNGTRPGAATAAGAPRGFLAIGGQARHSGPSFFNLQANPPAASGMRAIPQARVNAVAALGRSLGGQSVVTLDSLTGTPREVAKLNGFLTDRSSASPAAVALGYVRAHQNVFGLSDAELAALHESPTYRSIDGVTHLRWEQQYQGVPVFDNELRANVDRHGRLINVLGSPLTNTAVASTRPRLTATEALAQARNDAGAGGPTPRITSVAAGPQRWTHFRDGSQADLVIFHLPSGNILAWHLYAYIDSAHTYEYLLSAVSGRLLFRQNIVESDSGEGTRWLYNPSPIFDSVNGLQNGHTQSLVTFPDSWGPIATNELSGNNAHVYSDVNDNNIADSSEEVLPTGHEVEGQPIFNYGFTNFNSTDPYGLENCSTNFPCSWNMVNYGFGGGDNSWTTNRAQNATQVFWFINNYHDHLLASPIGFTPAAGNFQVNNHGQGGKGGDAVQGESDDGASTDGTGGPDQNHLDNANMATVQDGVPPRMQMYLFSQNGFVDSNGGDEADIVYHEYTHGLSHRLVTDAQGFPRLDGEEAGAMGEGWSDWYAMDYLVSQNLDTDTSATGDVELGYYVSAGNNPFLIRSEAMDCPLESTDSTSNHACTNAYGTGHVGGYTLADYGKVSPGGPEVHADGEIWGQTLWQIREAFQQTPNSTGPCSPTSPCSPKAEQLITRAMELSPPDPSMLDERNAILQADQADFGGADLNTLWSILAQRGMGYFAADLGSGDTSPKADFHTPPASRTSSLSGRITDNYTGRPVAGVTVMFANHADLSARTNSTGHYVIRNVAAGTYPYVFLFANGYDGEVAHSVHIAPGANTINAKIRRDWAARSGGGSVKSASKPDFSSFGCGPAGAIDGSQASGWASYSPNFRGDPGQGLPSAPSGARAIVIQLPHAVNIRQFAIDPGATCGDDDTASLGQFKIQVSSNGSTYHQVAAGTFSAGNNHRMNAVSLHSSGANTKYVRLIELGNQGPDGHSQDTAYKRFMDMSEIEAYGTFAYVHPHAAFSVSGKLRVGSSLTFSGAASTHDPHLVIRRYHWTFGDGSSATGKKTHHTYHRAGKFRVTLRVTDSAGQRSSTSKTLTISR